MAVECGLVLQMLTALAMIGLVLIQHGKGADMGASFGSGASGSLFGASGSANFLSRTTAVCAGDLLRLHARAGYFAQRSVRAVDGGSVLDRPAPSAPRVAALRRAASGGGVRTSSAPLAPAAGRSRRSGDRRPTGTGRARCRDQARC